MLELSTATQMGTNLNGMYDWGLTVIRAFQAAGNPAIELVARAFTMLGETAFYAIIFLIFWCVDEKKGFRLGLFVLFSNGINSAIKVNLRVPRPYESDPSVGIIHAKGYSTPSGHSQNSSVFWPLFMSGSSGKKSLPRRLRIAIAIMIPLCIGVSRIYLGVHYPTDVMLGWAIGALIASLAIFILPAAANALVSYPPTARFVESFNSYAEASGRSLRMFKIALAALVAFALNAFSLGDTSMGGLIFGFATGYVLLTDKVDAPRFSASEGSLPKKAIRLVLGFAGVALSLCSIKLISPIFGSADAALIMFIGCMVAGFWTSFLAPKLFMKLKLA